MALDGSGDDPTSATAHAVKLLSVRARTRQELELALQRRGYSDRARKAALARVAELGYLDDAAYARSRASALLSEGKYAPGGVVRRLVARGVGEAQARAAVAEAAREAKAPREVAVELLTRRGLWGRKLSSAERGKAARLLASRGFDEHLVEGLLGEGLDPGTQQD